MATAQGANQMAAPTSGPAGTPAAAPAQPTNMQAMKQAWFDQCKAFGEQAGAGDTSLVAWMQDTVQRAFRDELDPDDAAQGSKNYQESRRARRAGISKRLAANDGKADKVRESECRKMIKLGKLAQFRTVDNGGLGVFNRALKIIGDDMALKGEVAKHLLKVATEQLRKPDAPLDDDHIRQVLSPKEDKDKTEADFLLAARKQVEKAAELAQWDAHKRAVVTSINARLEMIHYKTKQQLADEAKAKAAAQAAKKKQKALQKQMVSTGATLGAVNMLDGLDKRGKR